MSVSEASVDGPGRIVEPLPGPRVTDRQLLQEFCRSRGQDPFAALMDRYETDLLRTATALLADPVAAQDAVQEAFLRLGRDADAVLARWPAGTDHLGGWLATVVRHWCIDQLRRERFAPMHGETLEAGTPAPSATVAAADTHATLWRAVGDLPEMEQAAVLLRYREDLSYQDIATRLGKTVTHVGVLLHQAIGRLRGSPALSKEAVP